VVLLGGGLQELACDGRVLDGGGVVDPEHGGEVQRVGPAGEGFLELPVDAESFQGGRQAAAFPGQPVLADRPGGHGGLLVDGQVLVAAGILDAVTQGLEPAHELGYVHRDISPRNVLALPDSTDPSGRRWVVADWGIVKRPAGDTTHRYTRTGEGLGTAGFAAPETWHDAHRVGCEADVYSLGRVVAWLLTGKWPSPNMPLLPEGPMRGLVAECTEPDPARRIPTVRALRQRVAVLRTTPALSPRAEVADLVQQAQAERQLT
jgi:hypothetical protein